MTKFSLIAAFLILIFSSASATIAIGAVVFVRKLFELATQKMETGLRVAELSLASYVQRLELLARIEARQGKDLKCEPCRLGALVDEASAAFAAQGGAQRLQLRLGHADTAVMVDPEKTHRAITNVLSNAFKYSPGGGAVELATVAGEVHGRPAVGLRVRDHGIGMTPEQLARVFERFYRADPSGNIPGTGLGMSIVKEIVELHRGEVRLASAPGQGTTVMLWLPLAVDVAAVLAAQPDSEMGGCLARP